MPALMTKLGLGEHAKKSARCCFHDDQRNSFSVWQRDGAWFWKCHAGCGEGDEISFPRKLKGLSQTDAVSLFLKMAGFPPRVPPKSHEYLQSRECRECPQSPKSPECHVCLVYPVSNGQGIEEELKDLAGATLVRSATLPERDVGNLCAT
jgi:hypothetical protein